MTFSFTSMSFSACSYKSIAAPAFLPEVSFGLRGYIADFLSTVEHAPSKIENAMVRRAGFSMVALTLLALADATGFGEKNLRKRI